MTPNAALSQLIVGCLLVLNATAILRYPGTDGVNRSVLAFEADINIGLLSSQPCGPDVINLMSKCGVFESFKYALTILNNRVDVLPNITLGYVALADCMNPVRGLGLSAYFVSEEHTTLFHVYCLP